MVRPVEQEHLAVELVLAGRDDLVELVPLPQLLQLGVLGRIEPEALRVLALDDGERVEPLHGEAKSAGVEHGAFADLLRRRQRREQDRERDHLQSSVFHN